MTKFLSVEQVILIHDALLEDHGGLPGIRDRHSLESAVNTPRTTMFGEELYPTIYAKAAAYLFHISRNHPFCDGNKRTAAFSALLFLQENQVPFSASDEDYEDFVVDVAEGKVSKEEIVIFFREASGIIVEIK